MIKENDFEYEEEIKETFEIKKSNIQRQILLNIVLKIV